MTSTMLAQWSALRHVSALGITGIAGMRALRAAAERYEEVHIVYSIAGLIAFLAHSYAIVGDEGGFLRSFGGSAAAWRR